MKLELHQHNFPDQRNGSVMFRFLPGYTDAATSQVEPIGGIC